MRRVSKTSPRSSIYNANVYGLRNEGYLDMPDMRAYVPMECPQQVDFLSFIREERQGKQPLDIAHLGVFTELAQLSSKLDGNIAGTWH